jgi:hypothetical protein
MEAFIDRAIRALCGGDGGIATAMRASIARSIARRGIMTSVSSDREPGHVAPAEAVALSGSGDRALSTVEPEALIAAFLHLRERIPEFVQLSTAEQHAKLRAASLDPAFIEAGLDGATAWGDEVKGVIGYTPEELRTLAADAARWDAFKRELTVLLEGIESANLTRRHRLGTAILQLYALLRTTASGRSPIRPELRPYFERMQRAYQKRRRK